MAAQTAPQAPDMNLLQAIDMVAKEKGIDRLRLVKTIEEAILKAAQSVFGPNRELEARFNEDNGQVDLFQYMTVVDDPWDDDREIHSRLKRIVRRIRRGPQKGPEARLGGLRLPPGAGGIGSPPRYIRDIAAAAGRPIDDHRWALLDPGSYGTKKILLFLVGPGDDGPGLVVKLVRDPRFNTRLERAWRALGALDGRGPELSRLGPRPAFFGHHAGLALMAESIVTGDSLKSSSATRPATRSSGPSSTGSSSSGSHGRRDRGRARRDRVELGRWSTATPIYD
jgi:hypothetical protein